ncbi:hypothetical protein SEVIR_2G071150v4 [Setaria viridis]
MPPPYCAWCWLRRALAVGWAPAPAPPREEETMLVWESLPDLEAAAPPGTMMPGATNDAAVDCFTGEENTVSCEAAAAAAAAAAEWLFTAINFLQVMLAALGVYMTYAMVRSTMDPCSEQGSELTILLLVCTAMCVSTYFGIASQVSDDVEAQCRT